jgi:hypothetical protein
VTVEVAEKVKVIVLAAVGVRVGVKERVEEAVGV